MNDSEVNFDGLVGPTHNYSGLSYGNLASMKDRFLPSNPKKAALQGLEKMYTLTKLGLKQGVLPPQERPFIPFLKSVGYSGNDEQILEKVQQQCPELLLAASSAACMWTANAATACPSIDSQDHRVHITPANLVNKLHRSFEAPTTSLILKKIFSDPSLFQHHSPLPSHPDFGDEGAANHTRLCQEYGKRGIHLFVYGRSAFQKLVSPKHFPARQTLEASQAIARLHQLSSEQLIFAQQNPALIDEGVFHNDVIAVGNQNVLFFHAHAFTNTESVIQEIGQRLPDFYPICVTDKEVTVKEAVSTYLFNSQLLTLPDQTMMLLAPEECQRSPKVKQYLDQLILRKDHPIKKVMYIDVRESMQNGGGPACLRLRVVLNEKEFQNTHSGVILNDILYKTLKEWIENRYRENLTPHDLADPSLLTESREALDELTTILQLGSIYPFQT